MKSDDAIVPAPSGVIGVLDTGEHITEGDALWFGRMVVGEGGATNRVEAEALVSALLRRWVSLELARGGGRDLTTFARAFAQPINPRWAEGGDLAARHPDHATPAHLARRARMASLPWESVPPMVRQVVVKMLSGLVPLTAAPALNWAAPSLYRAHGFDTRRRAQTGPGAVQSRDAGHGGRYVHLEGVAGVYSTHGTVREPVITPTERGEDVAKTPSYSLGVLAGGIVAGFLMGVF